jgi:hypothetical protein
MKVAGTAANLEIGVPGMKVAGTAANLEIGVPRNRSG